MAEMASVDLMNDLGVLLGKLSRSRQDAILYAAIATEVLDCIDKLKVQSQPLSDQAGLHDVLVRELFFAAKSAELRSPAAVVGQTSGMASKY